MAIGAPAKSPVTTYAEDVLSGAVVAGRLVRLACQRHLDDLATGPARGLWFDADAAAHATLFFSFLHHSKGEWAGQPFLLSPWQQFIVGSLFGWYRADGLRRFRTGYHELARKNGKSTLAAGIGLYLAFFDHEPGAEVYAAATKRDQAKIVWSEAKRMVLATPALRNRITAFTSNLHIAGTAAKFEPLGADADSMDGLNIHGAIVDELHAHKTRAMWDVLETATGARRQPLTFVITTAGFDRHSVCWEQRDYGVKVLEGILPDDSFFAFIATIDEGDDWQDPTCWVKANPNLGVSVKEDDLARKVARAREIPGQHNAIKRLHFDVWTEVADRHYDLSVWDENAGTVDPESLRGRACYLGLDLATVSDIAALALLFPPVGDEEAWPLFLRCWVPEEGIHKRARTDRVPYDIWADQGWITPTPGNVIDYAAIKATILGLGAVFQVRELGYDPWNATALIAELMAEGVPVVPVRQGFASLSAPTKALDALLLGRRLAHGGNPVLRWMASNAVMRQDPAGNLKPDKERSAEKIDGMVALIIALSRASLRGGDEGFTGEIDFW